MLAQSIPLYNPVVSEFGPVHVPLNPCTSNRVYKEKKTGITLRSRYRHGPVVADAVVGELYCNWIGEA